MGGQEGFLADYISFIRAGSSQTASDDGCEKKTDETDHSLPFFVTVFVWVEMV